VLRKDIYEKLIKGYTEKQWGDHNQTAFIIFVDYLSDLLYIMKDIY
jgi:UDP-galactopyranose mutase